ncbi:multiple C2 domain and transmembrane region protein isoform X2 [Oratosquilla oratoria]|uniref:multiple C2 domain and transmembrane region protein isoform X2 n=1 Tax=Oratosquilla oratoria TaxID=337810 RepID=UPI003F7694F9
MIVNELILYVTHCIQMDEDSESIQCALMDFYEKKQLAEAKEELWSKCGDQLGESPQRRDSSKSEEEVLAAEVIDSVKRLCTLDQMPPVYGQDVTNLPVFQPHDLNLVQLLTRIKALESKVDQHETKISFQKATTPGARSSGGSRRGHGDERVGSNASRGKSSRRPKQRSSRKKYQKVPLGKRVSSSGSDLNTPGSPRRYRDVFKGEDPVSSKRRLSTNSKTKNKDKENSRGGSKDITPGSSRRSKAVFHRAESTTSQTRSSAKSEDRQEEEERSSHGSDDDMTFSRRYVKMFKRAWYGTSSFRLPPERMRSQQEEPSPHGSVRDTPASSRRYSDVFKRVGSITSKVRSSIKKKEQQEERSSRSEHNTPVSSRKYSGAFKRVGSITSRSSTKTKKVLEKQETISSCHDHDLNFSLHIEEECRLEFEQGTPESPEDNRGQEDGIENTRGVEAGAENGRETRGMRRSFSKSASDLHRSRSASKERSAEDSPRGSPPLVPRHDAKHRSVLQKTSAATFFTSLKTKFQQRRHPRKKDLLDAIKSNSHPGSPYVSVERQDSTTDYAADNSSADHSSSATPLTMSPRRGPLHVQAPVRQNTLDSAIGSDRGALTSDGGAAGGGDGGSSTGPGGICGATGGGDLFLGRSGSEGPQDPDQQDPAVLRHRSLRQHSFYQLHVHLKRGQDLVPRDACGTSDPYVKFKVGGKMLYKSKTIYKDLNPSWDETFTIPIEDPFEPVHIKVFDYDWGLQDDFMGMASIDLTTLELDRSEDVTLTLQEPGKHDYMGTVTLNLTLVPKTQEEKEQLLQRGGSRLAEQQRRLKSQIWSSVVTIVLVEGKNLLPMDSDGTSDPYVKFRLGNEKYKSKTELRTLSPRWVEQFDFHLFEDQSQVLEITVWDKDARTKDDFMGRCNLELSQFEREQTHQIWAELEDGAGSIFLLFTISGTTSAETISDLHTYQENPREAQTVRERYKIRRSLHSLRDIGFLKVKVYRAQGLASADIGGKSDPFCVLELINSRLQTQTEYKTLSPSWNKIFTFNVKDIHSVLEITVYDEDRDHKVEFLGKIAIPLLRIRDHEKKWYALKDKKLRTRAKGNNPEILLECSVVWNRLRAAIRTFTPKEEKFMQQELKFKRQVFIRNVNRLRSCILCFIELGKFVKSCWDWESPVRSIAAFVVFLVVTYCFEVYMLPIMLLLLFLRNYIQRWTMSKVISLVGSVLHREEESELSGDEEDIDDEDKDKNQNPEEEKKSLKERLQAIQEVTATVQNAIGFIASIGESCKNTFNFSVPFLSWLAIICLAVGAVLLYYIPVRYLVMLWGINKFSRQLLRPHSMVNNELLDFLSRVPDDEELKDYRELRQIPHFPDDRRRDARKKKNL